MRRNHVISVAATGLLLSAGVVGCTPYLHAVDDGAYAALVPTSEQWEDDRAEEIPGGFAALRADGVERVVLRVEGDNVTVELDDKVVATRTVTERRAVQDDEGSGPFKAETEALALGAEALVLGSLVISEPVIWFSGGNETSRMIAVRPWDPDDRVPAEQCDAEDEQCLELPVGELPISDPVGEYEEVNPPEDEDSPISVIQVTDTEVVYTLAAGGEIRSSRENELLTRACAVSESALWPVPAEVGLSFDDPVLVETNCPIPSGAMAPSLTVMERAALPVLAPLATKWGGDWCQTGPACLWFVDEAG